MRIDLLRHGACAGGSIFRGSSDVPLTDEGWEQMSRGLEALAGSWGRVITSPLQRCQKFATRLGGERALPVVTTAGIGEIGFGEWEGQPVDKIWAEQKALCEAWLREPDKFSPPGGEPYLSFRARVLQTINELAERYPGESLLLVTHGGVIKLLLTIANNWPPSQMASLLVDYGFAASLEYRPASRDSEAFSVSYPEQSAYVYSE